MPIVLTAVFGPQSRIDLVGLGMIIGAVFAGALAWVIARTTLRGTNGLQEFGEFFEAKYHVRFASWLLVSGVATAIGIVCLAIFALRE